MNLFCCFWSHGSRCWNQVRSKSHVTHPSLLHRGAFVNVAFCVFGRHCDFVRGDPRPSCERVEAVQPGRARDCCFLAISGKTLPYSRDGIRYWASPPPSCISTDALPWQLYDDTDNDIDKHGQNPGVIRPAAAALSCGPS